MSSNSLATVKLKMKMLPAGFSVALCSTAIEFCDRRSNEVFSSFELLILSLTLLMLWTYLYQRMLRFIQLSILHFLALQSILGIIFSSLTFLLRKNVPELSESSEKSSAES